MLIIEMGIAQTGRLCKEMEALMPSLQAAPLLLIIITGLLFGLLTWGLLLSRRQTSVRDFLETPDYLRLGLLVLAIFSLGIFVAFALELFLLVR